MNLTDFTLAAALGLPAAACAWSVARAVEDRLSPRTGVLVWRAARLAAFAPLLTLIAIQLPGFPSPVWNSAPTASADRSSGQGAPALEPAVELAVLVREGAPASLMELMIVLYLCGLGVMVARAAMRRRAVRRLLAASEPASEPWAGIAARWRARLKLAPDRAPVRVVDAQVSPFVIGFFPVVLAPATLRCRDQAELAIAHELTHVRRGDERDRLLGEVLTILAWFNPFMAAIERRLAGARELACDADVLDLTQPDARRAYARAITELAPAQRSATAFLSDLPDLRRRRVAAVLAHGRADGSGHALAGLCAALVLVAGIPSAGLAAMFAEVGSESFQQESAQVLSEPAGALVLEAQTALEAGDHDAVLAILENAPMETDYERSVVLRLRGAALFELGRIEASAVAFQAAAETGAMTREEAHSSLFNAVQLYMVSERYGTAIEIVEQMEEDGFEFDTRAFKLVAQLYVQAGDPAAALPYAEAFMAGTQDPTRNELALLQYVYQETGRSEAAAEMAARIAAMDEN